MLKLSDLNKAMPLHNKHILLGITGSIAAYKSAALIRLLQKEGASVRVVMTKAATEFITPLTLGTLSKHRVYLNLFQQDLELNNIEHISLARWADFILIAPATANIMAKIAHGIADDLLSTICLAFDKNIFIAPAMNYLMWQNKITQENTAKLISREINIIYPEIGKLACGENNIGKMQEPKIIIKILQDFIAAHAAEAVQNKTDSQRPVGANDYSPLREHDEDISPAIQSGLELSHKKIIITAGPTQEYIDPVRFISSPSSGKMGFALAQAASALGAEVLLITGHSLLPTPLGVTRIDITSAKQMQKTVFEHIKNCDIFISAAAISDYYIKNISPKKIKKKQGILTLELIKTPDIIGLVKQNFPKIFTIGFAAETHNLIKNGKQKLIHKNLDMIIANPVSKNTGFQSNENECIIFTRDGAQHALEKQSKILLAKALLEFIIQNGEKNK